MTGTVCKDNNQGQSACLARPTCKRQTAVAGVTVDSISANALVQTRPRGTLVYVLLTVHSWWPRVTCCSICLTTCKIIWLNYGTILTSESSLAHAGVAVVSIQTGAAVLARTGLALILLQLTVFPHPARCTLANVAVHSARNFNDFLMTDLDCESCKFFPTWGVLVSQSIRNACWVVSIKTAVWLAFTNSDSKWKVTINWSLNLCDRWWIIPLKTNY